MPFSVKSYGEPPTYDEVAIYDANGNETYHGWADPGTLTSEAFWMILKTTYTVNGQGVYQPASWRWANGNRNFDKIFDDYATYSY